MKSYLFNVQKSSQLTYGDKNFPLLCRNGEKDYLLEKFNYNNVTVKAYKMDEWRTATFGYVRPGSEPLDPPPDPEPVPEPILTTQQIVAIYLKQNWFFILGLAAVGTTVLAVRKRPPRQYENANRTS